MWSWALSLPPPLGESSGRNQPTRHSEWFTLRRPPGCCYLLTRSPLLPTLYCSFLCHRALHTYPALSHRVHDLCKCVCPERQSEARLGNSWRGRDGSARDNTQAPGPGHLALPRQGCPGCPHPTSSAFGNSIPAWVCSLLGSALSLDPHLASY